MLGRVEMDKHQTNESMTYGSKLQTMTKEKARDMTSMTLN